jgi:hypothetical protein
MTNFDMKDGACVVYYGKNYLDGAPLHFFIKNSFGTDIIHNEPFNADVKRINYKNTNFMIDGVEIPNFENWSGIEIITPEERNKKMYYILHHLGNDLTFERPLESNESIWLQIMICPPENSSAYGTRMTLAVLPEHAKVIMPPSANDPVSKEYHFKQFGLIQDYIKFNHTPLII